MAASALQFPARLARALLSIALAVAVLGQTISHNAEAASGKSHVIAFVDKPGGESDNSTGVPLPDAVPDCAAHGCCSLSPAAAQVAFCNVRSLSAPVPAAFLQGTRTVLPDKPPRQ